MRWYDIEPDVFMAVSMIECANTDAQIEYAEYIISAIKENDKELNYIKNSTMNNISNKKFQRWYDKNELLSTAFEYLKCTSKDLQKEISLSVLAYKNSKEALV